MNFNALWLFFCILLINLLEKVVGFVVYPEYNLNSRLKRSLITPQRVGHQQSNRISSPVIRKHKLHLSGIEQNFIVASGLHIVLYSILDRSSQKSLTKEGLLHGAVLGTGLWTFLGWNGWKLGIAEKRQGARGSENLWGSAATAMICAMGTYILPQYEHLFRVAYVASLATKLGDTFSSELGKAFGKTTYLISNLKPVPRGTEGAVSLEGTFAGVVGSILISLLSLATSLLSSPSEVIICVIAAFLATTAESFIGATLQSKDMEWLSNELVNLIMTVIGAVIAVSLRLTLLE